MGQFKIKILVRLKKDVLDPQGDSVKSALNAMGIKGADNVRQGKVFDINIDADDEKKAVVYAEEMARKLLVNELIEEFEIEVEKE